jgi:hypothetical protein
MGLDGARRMITKGMKGRYQRSSRQDGSAILDELCALTDWHRDHAREAIRAAASPGEPRPPRTTRAPVLKYDEAVIAALRICRAELDIDDATAARLCAMSLATIDRRLAGDRKKQDLRSHTKPPCSSGRAMPATINPAPMTRPSVVVGYRSP